MSGSHKSACADTNLQSVVLFIYMFAVRKLQLIRIMAESVNSQWQYFLLMRQTASMVDAIFANLDKSLEAPKASAYKTCLLCVEDNLSNHV